jgi:transcriptional regulator with XRE-family HTH domain
MTDPATAPARSQRWLTILDGDRLRQSRRQRGLSQADLAGQAGISLTAVGRLERQSRASCRPRTLTRLAAALGKDPATLIPAQQARSPGGHRRADAVRGVVRRTV